MPKDFSSQNYFLSDATMASSADQMQLTTKKDIKITKLYKNVKYKNC